MRISDWSSDVCSSDLGVGERIHAIVDRLPEYRFRRIQLAPHARVDRALPREHEHHVAVTRRPAASGGRRQLVAPKLGRGIGRIAGRSEEHTSELQSLMRISYAVFCLKKKIDT